MKLSECKPGTFVVTADGLIGQVQLGIQHLSAKPGVIGVWISLPDRQGEYLVEPSELEKYEG